MYAASSRSFGMSPMKPVQIRMAMDSENAEYGMIKARYELLMPILLMVMNRGTTEEWMGIVIPSMKNAFTVLLPFHTILVMA